MIYVLIAIAVIILIAIIAKAANSSKRGGDNGKSTFNELVGTAPVVVTDDREIGAVIAAALAAYMAATPVEGLVVRRIRRIPSGKPAWSKAALHEQLGQKF
ncbi:MAG: hypothetical protein ACOYI4_09590 [Christensenellales bacterium]|jgi:hypothetical protein